MSDTQTASVPTGWCVVRCRPHQEEKARLNLARQGFEVYLPRYRKRRRHARRTDIVSRPLYPRYLFACIRSGQEWRPIRSTYGVSSLVEFDGRPALLADIAIEAIRRREDKAGLVVLSPIEGLKPGDTVRIVEGTLTNSLGLLERITDDQRVTLLLEMLGRKVRVSVDPETIEKAE